MDIHEIKYHAMRLAYQHRKPVVIVLDALLGCVRAFCAPHDAYLESEPQRYFPLEVVYPDGSRENAIE